MPNTGNTIFQLSFLLKHKTKNLHFFVCIVERHRVINQFLSALTANEESFSQFSRRL